MEDDFEVLTHVPIPESIAQKLSYEDILPAVEDLEGSDLAGFIDADAVVPVDTARRLGRLGALMREAEPPVQD